MSTQRGSHQFRQICFVTKLVKTCNLGTDLCCEQLGGINSWGSKASIPKCHQWLSRDRIGEVTNIQFLGKTYRSPSLQKPKRWGKSKETQIDLRVNFISTACIKKKNKKSKLKLLETNSSESYVLFLPVEYLLREPRALQITVPTVNPAALGFAVQAAAPAKWPRLGNAAPGRV